MLTFPGFAGLSLSFALSLTAVQVFLTKFYSYMENYIISVERIKQYMHLPPEPPAIIPENRAPSSWPQEGQIDTLILMSRSDTAQTCLLSSKESLAHFLLETKLGL
jgi:hypothetical protein